VKFYDLNLDDRVLDALDAMRFDECTPIQEHAIPPLLEGRDLIGVAQTGTGKTAAYLLPILSKLCSGKYPNDAVNCVIMSPTRELAQQIDQAMEGFSYYIPVSSVAVYGGNDGIRYEQERNAMAKGADIIIATPGRLISHLSLNNIDLSKVSFFILDEADRMLDMGFSDDILKIASFLPKSRQTIMFSATMPDDIQKLASSLLHDPVEIKLSVSKPADNIHQSAYICYETQKLNIIRSIFKDNKPERVLVFASSKLKVKEVASALKRLKLNADEMHSDLDQAARDEVMHRFRNNHIDILVATDIVARGIDIDDIQMVINYDVPHDAEDYVHRIGRTARANRDGIAITFVSEKEQSQFRQIEKFLGTEIKKNVIPAELGEAPTYDPHHHNDRNRDQGRNRNNRKDYKSRPQNNDGTKSGKDSNARPQGKSGDDKDPKNRHDDRQRRYRDGNRRPNQNRPKESENNRDIESSRVRNERESAPKRDEKRRQNNNNTVPSTSKTSNPRYNNSHRRRDESQDKFAQPRRTDNEHNRQRSEMNSSAHTQDEPQKVEKKKKGFLATIISKLKGDK
jgi:ATP-dependent RNA helicase RhlE